MKFLLKFTIHTILCSFILCSLKWKWKLNHGKKGGYISFGSLAEPTKWKAMAAILIKKSNQYYQYCGGSLMSHQHIITAAHCLIKNGSILDSESIIIRLGQYDLRQKGQDYKVASFVLHPNFSDTNYDNDIAVIKLAKKVKYSKDVSQIKYLKLKERHTFETENGNKVAFIAGWGRTSYQGQFNDQLLEAKLHIIPLSECHSEYKTYTNISTYHICAKAPKYSPNPSDACPGDSGGPLIQLDQKNGEYILTGVISFGRKCGLQNVAGVYTRVDYFSQWIKKVISLKKSNINPFIK